jgi:hypothetical protein
MFSINFANRLWGAMFGLALAEQVDSLDPDRLDPTNPPAAPWTLQASHPELLVRLADELAARNYSLREYLRLIAESSAYQLSSRYDGPWDITKLNLYARHYPRRLEGEELHDSIVKASGNEVFYKVESLEPTQWALQMPDPTEPRVNGQASNFMRPFYRGNRDSFFRIPDGSILQQLALMNDPFVTNRIKMNVSPNLRAAAQLSDPEAVEEIFLLYLNRLPDERERRLALDFLAQAGSQRTAYLEDLVWTLINKVDFLFNY